MVRKKPKPQKNPPNTKKVNLSRPIRNGESDARRETLKRGVGVWHI